MLWNPLIEKHIFIPDFTPKRRPQTFTNRPHNEFSYLWLRHLIEKYIIIPLFTPLPEPSYYLWLHHLYFDSISNDYKILVTYKNWYALYSCHNGIWGERKDIPVDLDVDIDTACVDGCIYGKCNDEIMCFDTRDGKLHKLPLPNIDHVEGFVLKDISGRLCLEKQSEYNGKLHLWVMEKNGRFEKSWKKLISIKKLEEPHLWSVMGLTNEDDVVLCGFRDNYLEGPVYKYNPRVKCLQEIKCDWNWIYYDDSFPYSKNLYIPSSNTP